jgi:hypothetical protein
MPDPTALSAPPVRILVVPPTGRHKGANGSDLRTLTGRLVVEQRISLDGGER